MFKSKNDQDLFLSLEKGGIFDSFYIINCMQIASFFYSQTNPLIQWFL